MRGNGTSHRPERVAARFARDVSVIVDSLDDPRVHDVTVIDAEMSRDLRYATIFVTINCENSQAVLAALNGCCGYIRHELAEENSEMRGVPQIRFVQDRSADYSNRIEEVIRGLHDETSD